MMFMWIFFSAFLYKSICCEYLFELDAVQVGTYNICLYKEVDKKYTGCNMEWLDCALIRVCAVIRCGD